MSEQGGPFTIMWRFSVSVKLCVLVQPLFGFLWGRNRICRRNFSGPDFRKLGSVQVHSLTEAVHLFYLMVAVDRLRRPFGGSIAMRRESSGDSINKA